jgi:hypothetical protein
MPQQQMQAAPSAPYRTIDPEQAQVVAGAPAQAIPSATTTQLGMLELMLPTEYRTPEWKRIIGMLLDTTDPEKVAPLLAAHIGHLDSFEMLPENLATIFDAPEETLTNLVMPLPAYATNREYCDLVIKLTVHAMVEYGLLEIEGEGDDEEGDEEGEEDEGDDTTLETAAAQT